MRLRSTALPAMIYGPGLHGDDVPVAYLEPVNQHFSGDLLQRCIMHLRKIVIILRFCIHFNLFWVSWRENCALFIMHY